MLYLFFGAYEPNGSRTHSPYATIECFKNSLGSFLGGKVACHALITLMRVDSL